MASRLRALVAFAEGVGQIPYTHMVTHNHPKPQFRGIQRPFLTSSTSGTHVVYTQKCRQNIHTHKINL